MREEIQPSEGDKHLAKIREELEPVFKSVSNTLFKENKAAAGLQDWSGRECQRWLTRDHELSEGHGRQICPVYSEQNHLLILDVKKDEEHAWASITHADVLKNNNV